ncbi:hypothetical protein, partial [Candidatus Avelusimicrobium alvi]|uniref:hypothetical protein n=1 Tax=Candidatus Avelusimicrobium alvi TaxID=3416221 RepID=UPI003D0C64C6
SFHPDGNGLNIPGEKSLSKAYEGIRPNRASPNLSKKKNASRPLSGGGFLCGTIQLMEPHCLNNVAKHRNSEPNTPPAGFRLEAFYKHG